LTTADLLRCADYSELRHMTVAAVDESYSSKRKNLAYIAVVCTIPEKTSLFAFPKPQNALKAPDEYGLVVATVITPLGNGHNRFNWWRKGIWTGLNYMNSLLRENGRSIDIAYIDGSEPDNFMDCEEATRRFNVKFESKHGTRTYEERADPFAVKLLTLTDAVVRQVREKVDQKGNLEMITDLLLERNQPCITLAPVLPDFDYVLGQYAS
jgi:hypothetical protein